MDKQIRYLPDETGKNQDNLVRKEPHHLPVAVRGRVIVPLHGSFFGESVVVRDRLSGRELTPKRDFTCAGLRAKQTCVAESAIYAFILVTDDKCSTDVEIDYQVYGNDMFQFVEPTIQLLEESFETNDGIPMAKLGKLPREWPVTFHYHDLGNIDKFDFMLFNLDKIRNCLLANNPAVFKYLLDFEKIINLLAERANSQFEADLFSKMREFRLTFGKKVFNVERVNNWPLMIENDGNAIATNVMHPQVVDSKEAYLNLGILAEYSKKLFEIYVNIEDSGLGSSTEFNFEASTAAFEALPIGAIFTINDYNFAAIAKNPEIETFYPDRLDRTNGYVIRKITSDKSGFGSMYLYTGRANGRTYVMRLSPTEDGKKSSFRYIANSLDQSSYLPDIQEHIDDRTNPHMDDKRDVDLAQVENLPISSKEDLFCNMPVRKYLTVESILHYMKRFKTGKKDTSEIFSNLSEASVRKQMQTIYSPCGAWDDNMDIDKIELCRIIEVPTTLPPPEPKWAVAPDKNLIRIVLLDEDDTSTTTTTTTSKAPSKTTVAHYGEFISSDGMFYFCVVSDLPNGTQFSYSVEIEAENNSKIINVGTMPFERKEIIPVQPPHTMPIGGFDFTNDFYEIRLVVREKGVTGPIVATSDWIQCYNMTPVVDKFDLFAVQVIGKNEEDLCTTGIFDGYYDSRYDGGPEMYKQWLGYGKADQLMEFAAWKSTRGEPYPGKTDIYLKDYFAKRGPSNYKKSHIDPGTGKPRDMEFGTFGWWYANGTTIPGAPWPKGVDFKEFDIKVRYYFFRDGQADPLIVNHYHYREKEQYNPGLPSEENTALMGTLLSKLTITSDNEILIEPTVQLIAPPSTWVEELYK